MNTRNNPIRLLGLRTVIYHVDNLDKAREWYSRVFGIEPYFSEPYYTGFAVGGYELGLDPDVSATPSGNAGQVAYWGVDDVEAAWDMLLSNGATPLEPPTETGGGIIVATVTDPFGNIIGLIRNPHFNLGNT